MSWVLWIYWTCTGGGCTQITERGGFPSYETCAKAIAESKINLSVGTAMFCAPKQGAKP